MKSKLTLIFILFSLEAFSQSKTYIISGYDDVLRQANNTGLIQVSLKAFASDITFAGMPALYQTLSPNFFIVSAISKSFEKRIENFLNLEGYPERENYLRSWTTEWSIENFKIKTFEKIFNNHPNDKFIVILDNSKASLNFAATALKKFPEKILRIYIRQVVSKESIPGTIPFYTAFDIALSEYSHNNLELKDLAKIATKVISIDERFNLIPDYAQCPTKYPDCNLQSEEAKSLCSRVAEHLKKACAAL